PFALEAQAVRGQFEPALAVHLRLAVLEDHLLAAEPAIDGAGAVHLVEAADPAALLDQTKQPPLAVPPAPQAPPLAPPRPPLPLAPLGPPPRPPLSQKAVAIARQQEPALATDARLLVAESELAVGQLAVNGALGLAGSVAAADAVSLLGQLHLAEGGV